MMDIPIAPDRSYRKRPLLIGVGVVSLVIVSLTLARIGPADPSVSMDRLLIDEVVRGDLISTVNGPGRLLPQDQHLIPAPTSGRVQERLVEASSKVKKGDILLLLANPEVDLQLLEAGRDLAETRMARHRLVTENNMETLSTQRELASLRTRMQKAQREHVAMSALLVDGVVSKREASDATALWQDLTTQVQFVEQQLTVMKQAFLESLQGQDEEVKRVGQVAAFHRQRVASLTVRSATNGVVQDISVEQGQWVASGQQLARVIKPGILKAEIRVPEARAGEVRPGQLAVLVIRSDLIHGVISRVNPAALRGSVAVEVKLDGGLPLSARPDLNLEGQIETGRIEDTLHLRRPASASPDQKRWMYRLDGEGNALRVPVILGQASSERIAIIDGAQIGDRFIVSEMTEYGEAPRIRLLE